MDTQESNSATGSIGEDRIGEFLRILAEKRPAPGGGAVAGLCGAVGAALAQMVNSYSVGRKSLAEYAGALADDARALETYRDTMLALADADALAYARLNALERLDKDDPARAAYDDAVRDAIAVPTRVMECAGELMSLCDAMVGRSNPWLMSDLAIAAVLADACCRAGAWNVRVNAGLVKDKDAKRAMLDAVRERVRATGALCAKIESACESDDA